MLVELLEDDETALIAVVRSYRRAMQERGMDPGIVTPDSLVRSLIHRGGRNGIPTWARALGVSFDRPGALA